MVTEMINNNDQPLFPGVSLINRGNEKCVWFVHLDVLLADRVGNDFVPTMARKRRKERHA